MLHKLVGIHAGNNISCIMHVFLLSCKQNPDSHLVQGLVVMSGELEAAYRSISMGRLPELWARVSYPSLKPLSSYLEDLYARLAMLQVCALLMLSKLPVLMAGTCC